MNGTPVFSCRFIGMLTVAFAFAPDLAAQTISTTIQGTAGSVVGGVPIVSGGQAGIISGTVVDEHDAPVANAMVQGWFDLTTPDGVRRSIGGPGRPTDQTGHFTLDRLQPGDYVVAVMPFGMRPYGPSEQMTYGVTYFPGVTDLAEAKRVTAVESGGTPITIRVRRAPAFHVRGTVASPSGRSPVGLSVQLAQQVFSSNFMRANSVVQPDGSFDLSGVAPGVYTLSTRIGIGDVNSDFAVTDIKVADRDLEGVRLNLTSGGTIRGRLVLDNPPKGSAPLGVSVQLMPDMSQVGNIVGRMPGSAAVAGDWTFEMRGLYGQYRFNLQTQGLPDYALVRTVLDGRDIGNLLDVPIKGGTHELVFYLVHR